MRKVFIIPSYEPTEKLLKVTNEILTHDDIDLIVVNDGSKKEYDTIFNELDKRITLLSYDTNMGKGYALKHAFRYVVDTIKESYVVVTLDSDGQHDVGDAIHICEYAIDHPNTLVLGKRLRGRNTPLRSRLGNSITRLVFRLSTGVDIYDTQTGLRGFTNLLMDDMLASEGNRFEYEMNVLTDFAHNKINMKELEIKTIYEDNNSGSHFHAIRDSYLIYKNIIKFSGSSLISFVLDYILYTTFYFLFSNIIISNICARIISATANYSLNRMLVFKSKKSVGKSLLEYALLAICILIINTGLLHLLSLIIHPLIAKIFVEILLFFVSYTVQKNKVFK